MKNKILFLILCFWFIPEMVLGAAGYWDDPEYIYDDYESSGVKILNLTWHASSVDATVPEFPETTTEAAQLIDFMKNWEIIKVCTKGGATAPTDNWDLFIAESFFISDAIANNSTWDVFGGETNNRDTTTAECATPLVGNAFSYHPTRGIITVNVSGNAVNSAIGYVSIILERSSEDIKKR